MKGNPLNINEKEWIFHSGLEHYLALIILYTAYKEAELLSSQEEVLSAAATSDSDDSTLAFIAGSSHDYSILRL